MDHHKESTLAELAEILNLPFQGNGDLKITHCCGLDHMALGGIAYIDDKRALDKLKSSNGTNGTNDVHQMILKEIKNLELAVIVPTGTEVEGVNLLFSPDPIDAHASAANYLQPILPGSGKIHPAAYVDEKATIGANVTIDPNATIYDGVTIGDNTVIRSGVVIMPNTLVGDDCIFYPNVTIRENTQIGNRVILHSGSVIGSDGYGFFQREGKSTKKPQVGIVVIEDDVEIGACSCVDNARFYKTVIKRGCKLDNLIHIAHNVVLGEDGLIAAQSGVAGSAIIGNNLKMGGQAGIVDNITVGKEVTVFARTLLTGSVKEGQVMAGMPSRPMKEWQKTEAMMPMLSGMFDRLMAIERFIRGLGFKKE